MSSSTATLDAAEGVVLALLVASFVLLFAIRRLGRSRPGFNIVAPIAIAVIVRVLAVAFVNATGRGATLRGGDETTFLDLAHTLAGTPWGRGFFPHGPYQLQTDVFAIQIKLFQFDPTAIRMTQIGISLLGMVFIIAAVYDLAGPRAARLLAWIFAFEPSNVFFNSVIHKEPNMVLASGLVMFGCTKMWRRFDVWGGAVPCALGGFIAVETRSYAGWFLVIGAVLVLFHSALRRLHNPLHALPVVYVVIIAGVLAAPTLLRVTSHNSLQTLVSSQQFTTVTQAATNTGGTNADNLALESVNLSTRSDVILALPGRVFDLIFRPYLWQLSDVSQELGAIGTVVALAGLALLLRYAWLARRRLIGLTAPLLYPGFFLLCAYALAAGNAGTGFRYRSHIVLFGAATLVVLREHVLAERAGEPVWAVASDDALEPALVPA